MSAPTGSVSKVRAARAAGKRAGLKDIRAIDPTWSSASLAARRRVVTPTGQGQKGSVSRGRRGLPGGAAGLNGGERRRIGTRKPGAGLITESDIEPGRPAASLPIRARGGGRLDNAGSRSGFPVLYRHVGRPALWERRHVRGGRDWA